MTCACRPEVPGDTAIIPSVTGCSHAETRSQKSALIRATATRRINSGENPQKAALRIEICCATGPKSSAKPAVSGANEHRGSPSLEVDFPLESAIQQSLDSLLRFRPRQRSLEGGEGI